MSTIKGIVIPADEEQPIKLVEVEGGNYREFQKHVGGNFDAINIERPEASIFIHDEGKIIGLPLNRRASVVLWVHNKRFRHVDAIMGDALLIGAPDDVGDTQGIPEELINLFLETDEWKYEVQVYDEQGWHGNQITFNEVFDAYDDALVLADRWSKVEEIRIVALHREDHHCLRTTPAVEEQRVSHVVPQDRPIACQLLRLRIWTCEFTFSRHSTYSRTQSRTAFGG